MASFNSRDLLLLVRDFGEPAVLTQKSNSGYDPATGQLVSATSTNYNCTAYFYNYEAGFDQTGQYITRGTRRAVISALDIEVEPDDGDALVGSSETAVISRVSTIFSAGQKICYICHLED